MVQYKRRHSTEWRCFVIIRGIDMKNHSKFLIPGIIVVGMILRLPFTAMPPILSSISKSEGVPVGQLGMLTTIPLIAFALFSSTAPKVAQKIGLERAFALMLMLLIVGSGIRVVNTTFLYIGTMLIGIGVAHMNVLLPSVIRTYFPMKVGPMTSVFTFSMMLATAVGASLAAPITALTSWQVFVGLLTILLVGALLVWLPNERFAANRQVTQMASDHKKTVRFNVWKNRNAWLLLFFGGMQSAMFYVLMAWGPTMAIQTGLTPATAGLFSGLNSLIGLPFALTVPSIVVRLNKRQRQWLVAGFSVLGTIGYLLLLNPQGTFTYWLLVNLFIGVGTSVLFPYLMTTFTLKTSTPGQTAQLSGMSQSGGYLIAAVGPAMFGYAYGWWHSWTPQIIVIVILFILMTLAIVVVENREKIIDA